MAYVKFFEIAGEVALARATEMAAARKVGLSKVGSEVLVAAQGLSHAYKSGQSPSFDDPVTRLAYVVQYVAVQADLLNQAMWSSPVVQGHLESVQARLQSVPLCLLGAGSATEVLALVKHAEQRGIENRIVLDCISLDAQDGWRDCRTPLVEAAKARLERGYGSDRAAWPVAFSSKFYRRGLTRVDKCEIPKRNPCRAQFYVANYLISDCCACATEALRPFFAGQLRQCAPKGALIVIVDRLEDKWVGEARDLCKRAGFEEVTLYQDSEGRTSGDEELASLGETVMQWLGSWRPRLKSQYFRLVGRRTG